MLSKLRAVSPTTFIVLWTPDATEEPALRIAAFAAGANMVRLVLSSKERFSAAGDLKQESCQR